MEAESGGIAAIVAELASQLGTSHQLLTHYLQRLDRWQLAEQAKAAREQSVAIRTRAESQGRPLDQIEESAVRSQNLAAAWFSIEATLLKNLDQIKGAAKLGLLDWHQFQILKRMVNGQWAGVSEAQGLLQKIRMGQIKILSKREKIKGTEMTLSGKPKSSCVPSGRIGATSRLPQPWKKLSLRICHRHVNVSISSLFL